MYIIMNRYYIFFIIFSIFCSNAVAQSETMAEHPEQTIDFANLELDIKLLKGVRWVIEEEKEQDMIEVYHAVEVVDISKVDVDTMSIRVEIHLRQRWDSKDLNIPEGLFEPGDPPDTFIRASPQILESLWSPDSYIPYARETKIASFTTTQSVVNIFKNKTIVYKARLYTVLGCAFNFQWYPLDKQTCDLTIESCKIDHKNERIFRHTISSKMVSYLWEDIQTPVILSNLKLLQYDMVHPLKYGNGTSYRWGIGVTYPYVFLRFEFERRISHNLIQVFTPTTLIVTLSWFSFWLGLDAVPGRVSLLITCVLALITMHAGLKGSIPPVNYVKVMDIWMVCCIAFVFSACLEFVVVKYLHWRNDQNIKAKQERENAISKYFSDFKIQQKNNINGPSSRATYNPYLEFYKNMNYQNLMGSEMMQSGPRLGNNPKPAWEDFQLVHPTVIAPSREIINPLEQDVMQSYRGTEWPFTPKKNPIWVSIDRVSRVAFPLTFLAFNLAFWPFLIIGAANQ